MTRETLDALKKLEAKATAGPWQDNGYLTVDGNLRFSRTVWVKPTAEQDEDEKYQNVLILEYPHCFKENAVTEEQTHHNLRMVAAARNSLPQLLRIAEAAMELMSRLSERDLDKVSDDICNLRKAIGGDDAT